MVLVTEKKQKGKKTQSLIVAQISVNWKKNYPELEYKPVIRPAIHTFTYSFRHDKNKHKNVSRTPQEIHFWTPNGYIN